MESSDTVADLGLERALLAALLADNRGFDRLGQLQPEDLSDVMHAAALAAAFDLRAERSPVNLVTLRSRFANVPFDDSRSVVDYLQTCANAGTVGDVADMARALSGLSHRRQIKALGEQIAASVSDFAASPATLLTDGARQLDDLLAKCRPTGRTFWDMSAATDDMLAVVAGGDKADRIPFGLLDLDRVTTGGMRRKQTYVAAGRTSMGKSALGVAISRRVGRAGIGVVVFSLEMTARQWYARMTTDSAGNQHIPVEYGAALGGSLGERERQLFEREAAKQRELPIFIEERSGLTAADISSGTRRAREQFERKDKSLGLVIVDHLGKLRPSANYRGQKVHEVSELSEAMTHLAKAENVAVLVLHQVNRSPEARENKRPSLSDLRDSGSVEQDADTVLMCYRPGYYLERMKGDGAKQEQERVELLTKTRNVLELSLQKNRDGPICTIELYCDMAANAIRDKRVAA